MQSIVPGSRLRWEAASSRDARPAHRIPVTATLATNQVSSDPRPEDDASLPCEELTPAEAAALSAVAAAADDADVLTDCRPLDVFLATLATYAEAGGDIAQTATLTGYSEESVRLMVAAWMVIKNAAEQDAAA